MWCFTMRTFLAVVSLFFCTLSVRGVDVYPQLLTLDGKTYTQVKVMKVSPAEIRIMHADGFATIPLSALPPEIRVKYGVADTAAEAMQEQQRKQGNTQAFVQQRQDKEALQLMEVTGLSLTVLKQAVSTRDWCQANPSGGLMNGATVDAAARTALLAQATEVLNTRRIVPVEAPPPTAPMPAAVGGAGVVIPGFVPGIIHLLSARYSLPNEQARNVKNRLAKLIPTNAINAPISIQVTDQLSDAALDQGNFTTATGVGVSVTKGNVTAGVAEVVVQQQGKNYLTVEYMYNGQKFKKQAAEGTYLVLP
jgi:hypothetical protein